MSLVDRDHKPFSTTTDSLVEKGIDNRGGNSTFKHRMWRRRHIESYMLHKAALLRLTKQHETLEELETWLSHEFSLTYPDDEFLQTEETHRTSPVFMTDGKTVLNNLGINKFELASSMNADEICEDVATLIDQIIEMCN